MLWFNSAIQKMKAKKNSLWSLNSGDFPVSGLKEDQLCFLLGYAALAPSGHNTQPWLFRVGGDQVEVIADRTRALPVVDPHDRELIISCGAAIEMFSIAARQFGFNALVDTHTANEPDLVARIGLENAQPPSIEETELFDSIPQRRTDRTAYSMEPLPSDLIKACHEVAESQSIELVIIEKEDARGLVANLVAEGDRRQFSDPQFRRELGSWVRSAGLGNRDGMSGASFGMPDVLSPLGHFVIRTYDFGDNLAARDNEKVNLASPALLLLGSATDNQRAWLATGRALARILLLLNSKGFSASYLNQPIEVESLRPRLRDIAEMRGYPQILLRAGRSSKKLRPTVRRDLSDVVIE